MKAPFIVLFVLTLLAVVACIDDDDGRQACEALASKCLPVGRSAKCDAKAINASPRGSEIEDCMQGAADCDGATACLARLER
jgi:hypothetical protein